MGVGWVCGQAVWGTTRRCRDVQADGLADEGAEYKRAAFVLSMMLPPSVEPSLVDFTQKTWKGLSARSTMAVGAAEARTGDEAMVAWRLEELKERVCLFMKNVIPNF